MLTFFLQGLLKMSLLERLRYILEVVRPPARVATQVLQMLCRISRHSVYAAYQVSVCRHVLLPLATVVCHLMIFSWESEKTV